jgi:hypothetical protein
MPHPLRTSVAFVAGIRWSLLVGAAARIGLCCAQSGFPEVIIHFPVGSTAMTAEADSQLTAFRAGVTLLPGHAFFVKGFSDNTSFYLDNKDQAQARAKGVRRALIQQHVPRLDVIVFQSREWRDLLISLPQRPDTLLDRSVRITYAPRTFTDTEDLRRALMRGTVQRFVHSPGTKQVYTGRYGTQVFQGQEQPQDSLLHLVTEPFTIELIEAPDLAAMIAHRLSTRSPDQVLATLGMASVRFYDAANAPLRLISRRVRLAIPTHEQLWYEGMYWSEDGAQWTKPGWDNWTIIDYARHGGIVPFMEAAPQIPPEPKFKDLVPGAEPEAPSPPDRRGTNAERINAKQVHAALRAQYVTDSTRYAAAIAAYMKATDEWNQEKQGIVQTWQRSIDRLKADGWKAFVGGVQLGWAGVCRPLLPAETTAVRTITVDDPPGDEEAFFLTLKPHTLVRLEPDGQGKLTTGPVPENRSALLIAYRVTQGKVGISIQRLWMGEPLTPRPLSFTTSNIVEFVHLLDQLTWPSMSQALP